MSYDDLLDQDPNSSASIFIEQKGRPFQQISTRKKIMYGMMVASPFLTVGIYALVVGAAVFNPSVTAATLLGAVKTYEKKAGN